MHMCRFMILTDHRCSLPPRRIQEEDVARHGAELAGNL